MGEPIARRLLDAGHTLCVWNRTPGGADGLARAGRAGALGAARGVRAAEVCVTMVLDDAALEDVTEELLLAPGARAVLVDMSTVSPGASRQVAEAARRQGSRTSVRQ
jgi:3-hydroxyisobutyrate dehydrogenase-like beta-hydroxyacid dehydrogenase